ncbi:aldehyde dehydrogenase family protein [Pseudomaricurvus sp. HS19]|nr:aldehyde dehydrogenase family protein [Pseudomaricurvus sp. HS19]
MQQLFDNCRAAFCSRQEPSSCAERLQALDKLSQALLRQRQQLVRAVDEDFGGRSVAETLQLELYGLLDEIRYMKKNLRKWMKPQRVATNALFRPSRCEIRHQPLGVIGIMGAYNYPLLLTLSPLIGALAAGNHALIRPSANTPHTAKALANLVRGIFPEEFVSVVEPDAGASREFSALPFDHLIFTGSAPVGRKIMAQAAANLTPVTLELGGKSPAIIAPGYDLQKAASEIVFAKFINAGQTCVAPDYVLVPEALLPALVEQMQLCLSQSYPALVDNNDYSRIINAKEYQRLQDWVDQAEQGGAGVLRFNPREESCGVDNGVFPPTLVWGCGQDCSLLQEEIFGPVLPLVGYRDLQDAIERVNQLDRPLALYYFDNDKKRIDTLLAATLSGGVTINGCVYHVAQHNLPFGGVGASGIGHYHGVYSFEAFSKKRPVFFASRWMNTKLMKPPYGRAFAWLIGTLLKRKVSREQLDGYRT